MGTIARIVLFLRNAAGLPGLASAPLGVGASSFAGVTGVAVPRHDPVPSSPFLYARPPRNDAVPRDDRRSLRPVRRIPWFYRVIVPAVLFGALQLATAKPITPSIAPAGGWFAIVLVSVNQEPLHPIAKGYLPAVFYADRPSCLRATRASVREMAGAGIRGRFLCMFPREPDDALAREPIEQF